MHPLTYFIIFIVLIPWQALPQDQASSLQDTPVTVYRSGEAGYSHYRIPALACDERFIYAFAEARKFSSSDNGTIHLVLKRSSDEGVTWSNHIEVVSKAEESAQNPTPIVVPGEGKLLLLFTKRTVGADTEHMIRAGTAAGEMTVYSTYSLDQGLNWSQPIDITQDVKPENWRWYAVGPGGAIVMTHHPEKKGRIVVPANHSTDQGSGNDFLGAHVIYSDDAGRSWQVGAIDSEGFGTVNPNETAVVELDDGRLYFNTRNHAPDDTVAHRAYAISLDGGESFEDQFTHEPALLTPIVHASLARADGPIYFVGPYSNDQRVDLSLWKNNQLLTGWDYEKKLFEGPSAYSSSLVVDHSTLAILYEVNDYEEIVFQRIFLHESK